MWGLGNVLFRAGQAERGVEVLKRAERLAPLHPASLLWTLAQGQLHAGHYEDAIHSARRASVRAPDRILPHIQMTVAYSALGRMEEARDAAAEVLRIDPKFTASGWRRRKMPDYKDPAEPERLASLLVKAGLPE
jgi:adenylate cyclase